MSDEERRRPDDTSELDRMRARAARERAARLEAESIAERATLALWIHNEELEERVRERTMELEVAHAEAEAASAVKDTILASLAHEVRTPLTVIVAACEELGEAEPADAAGRVELSRAALAAADGLDRVLSQMLRMVTDPVPVGADSVTESLATDLEARFAVWAGRAASGGALLVADVDPLLDTSFRVDVPVLAEALDEVLDNAVRFGGHGAVDVLAELFGYGGPMAVVVTVTDHGPGLAEADLDRIFEPFVQLDSGSTRRHGGLGMGLTVAAHLVRRAGGTIRAESAGPGAGTTIRLILPLQPARRSSDTGAQADRGAHDPSQEERRRHP